MIEEIRFVKRIARIVTMTLLSTTALAYLLNSHITQLHLESTTWAMSTRIGLFISTFNCFLSLLLVKRHVSIYRRIPTQFTLGLVVFSVLLAFYTLTSNPVFPIELGYQSGSTQNPFTFVSDLFISAAILALLVSGEDIAR